MFQKSHEKSCSKPPTRWYRYDLHKCSKKALVDDIHGIPHRHPHPCGIPRSTDQDFQQCGRRRRVPSPLHGTSQSTLSYLPGVHELEICWVIFSWSPYWYYWSGINIPTRSIPSGIPKDLILKRWSWSQAITSNFPLFEVFDLPGYPGIYRLQTSSIIPVQPGKKVSTARWWNSWTRHGFMVDIGWLILTQTCC